MADASVLEKRKRTCRSVGFYRDLDNLTTAVDDKPKKRPRVCLKGVYTVEDLIGSRYNKVSSGKNQFIQFSATYSLIYSFCLFQIAEAKTNRIFSKMGKLWLRIQFLGTRGTHFRQEPDQVSVFLLVYLHT